MSTARSLLTSCAVTLALAGAVPRAAWAEPGASAGAGAAAAASPGPWLKATVERARKLADRPIKAGTPAEEAWRKEVKAAIDDVVDWGELTRRSLGKTWDTRSEAEQKEFATLLRAIVEASYEQRLQGAATRDPKDTPKVEITWGAEKITGTTATAEAKVQSGKDGAALQFALIRAGDRWRVYDVSIDEVSTLRTYRSQFNKIISERGFPELIARMKKKVDEIRSGKGTVKPADLQP